MQKNNAKYDPVKQLVRLSLAFSTVYVFFILFILIILTMSSCTYNVLMDQQNYTVSILENLISESYQYGTILTNKQYAYSLDEDYDAELYALQTNMETECKILSDHIDPEYSASVDRIEKLLSQMFACNSDLRKSYKAVSSESSTLLSFVKLDLSDRLAWVKRLFILSVCACIVVLALSVWLVFFSAGKLGNKGNDIAKKSESKSFIDALTGLFNRKFINEKLPKKIASSGNGVFYMFDMDNFKSVNDTFGHSSGDLALVGFAEVLKEVLRPGDIACRFGGDEFVVFVNGIETQAAATHVYERIRDALVRKFADSDLSIITLSCGASFSKEDEPFEELFARADNELYKVKEHGKNNLSLYKTDSPN